MQASSLKQSLLNMKKQLLNDFAMLILMPIFRSWPNKVCVVCSNTIRKAMRAVNVFESRRKAQNIHVPKHLGLNLSPICPSLLEMTN